MNEPENPFDQNGTEDHGPSSNAVAPQESDSRQNSNPSPNASPDSLVSDHGSQSGDSAPSQPQYGQVKVPEYGAMASQFPPQYNPYVYGKPDNDKPQNQNPQNQANSSMNSRNGAPNQQAGALFGNNMGGSYQGNPNNQGNIPYGSFGQTPGGYGSNPNNPYGQSYNNGQIMPGEPGYQPDIRDGVDMNDPNQNPLKGHWDSFAIISVILLFLPITFLPVITGGVSMWRTKKYHMKGFWLAAVCTVLGIIATVFEYWLMSKGINFGDFAQQLQNQYAPSTGGGNGSVNA